MKLKLPNFGSLCKENILVNGDFQINPRGQSSYVFGEYSVAMWFCNGESVGWTEDGITFHNIWQKLPPLKNGKYMFSYRKHNTNEQKYIELSSNNATAKDGYLQVTLQTDSNYTKFIIAKDGGGQTDRISFVRLDEGTVKYKHRKEDKAVALLRCQKHIDQISGIFNGFTDATGKFITIKCDKIMNMEGSPILVGNLDLILRLEGSEAKPTATSALVKKETGEIVLTLYQGYSSLASRTISGRFESKIIVTSELL